jgi:type I restriction enzyme S subunit
METLQPKLRFPEYKGNWKIKSLGDIGEFIGGGTPSTSNDKFWNGDINWFTPTEIKKDYVYDSLRKISELGLQKSSAKLLPVGTILLTTRATIGDVAIATIKCTTNQGFQSLVTNEFHYNYFIFNWFKKSKHLLMEKANGSTFPEISKSAIEKIALYIPSLEEQTKIANFLTSVDEKLNLLKEKKSLLEDYKKGIMQKIFNQELRFKDDNGNDFKDWEEKQVKDIFKVTRGTVLSMLMVKENIEDDFKYPVYSSQTKQKGLAGYYNSFLFENAITWTTDGAGAGDVNYREGKFYCTNVCGVLINDDGYCNLLIAEILNSVSRKYVSYVGNPKLMNNVMADITIYIPSSIKEQDKISEFLSAIDEKIELVSNQIQDTQEYKKGLLQQMFV